AMKNVYSKVDSSERMVLSPKAREMVSERLEEIHIEIGRWIDSTDPTGLSGRRDPKGLLAARERAKEMLLLLSYEIDLYHGALHGKLLSEIAACKNKIRGQAKEWGQQSYVKSVIERFDAIVAAE
ncbi:MAG: hypothetical protein V1728_02445, partial [Candidatus Micrarchaeota archaeon]